MDEKKRNENEMENEMERPKNAFEEAAGDHRPSLASEFIHFMRENKKWWLAPFLLALAVAGLMVVLAETGAAPFIYSFF